VKEFFGVAICLFFDTKEEGGGWVWCASVCPYVCVCVCVRERRASFVLVVETQSRTAFLEFTSRGVFSSGP